VKVGRFGVPEWELLVPTPAVFVRAANTGLTGYGTRKKIRNLEELREEPPPTPLLFVSVASKGVKYCTSSLFATLARWFGSVASKKLRCKPRFTPLPPPLLKRYDSKRVRGWGSAKRLWGKDLGNRK
jgi:hypothetical protein